MKRTSRFPRSFFVLAVALSAAALSAVAPGCGRQGEGERCDPKNNDDDCEASFECRQGARTNVCCPVGAVSEDERCNPITGAGGNGGTGGTTTTTTSETGGTNTGGTNTGGTATGGTTGGTGTGATGGTGGTAGTGGTPTSGSGGTGAM